MNLKFFLASTATFLVTTIVGFITGGEATYNFLIAKFGKPRNEELFAYSLYMTLGAFFGIFVANIVSLITIHKLGKRWGSQLNFGGHPVFKLTFLSFLSFLGLLFLLLALYPSK